ncbi:MAG: hypothetical protein MUQ10_14015, partial [Anaerolineae bacterium]|nr:hypothetical protein [Anaerolineae bacterium]
MKRHLILVGVASFALLAFALLTAALASPERAFLLQAGETEPNNDFGSANSVPVPGAVTGVVSNTNYAAPGLDTQDYFRMETIAGRQYRATLSVLQNPGSMSIRIRLYNGDQTLVETSSSSPSEASVTWTAYQDAHYVRVEALLVTTSTVLVANYQLDVDELASTPTPTNTPLPGADDYEP